MWTYQTIETKSRVDHGGYASWKDDAGHGHCAVEIELFGGILRESQVVTLKGNSDNFSPSRVQVNLLNGGFSTHSTHMSHRLVGSEIKPGVVDRLRVKGPKDGALAPPGWYQMTVVENGVPSEVLGFNKSP
jgi:hypothetical protein